MGLRPTKIFVLTYATFAKQSSGNGFAARSCEQMQNATTAKAESEQHSPHFWYPDMRKVLWRGKEQIFWGAWMLPKGTGEQIHKAPGFRALQNP